MKLIPKVSLKTFLAADIRTVMLIDSRRFIVLKSGGFRSQISRGCPSSPIPTVPWLRVTDFHHEETESQMEPGRMGFDAQSTQTLANVLPPLMRALITTGNNRITVAHNCLLHELLPHLQSIQ